MTTKKTPPKESEARKFVEDVARLQYFPETNQQITKLIMKARRIRKKWGKKRL